MRIGILQFSVTEGNRDANFSTVLRLTEQALNSSAPPDVIVLPELWSTGYALDRAEELASPFGSEEARFLKEISRKFGVSFAGGSVMASVPLSSVSSSSHRSVFFNRAQVIDEEGRYIAAYDKIHLFRPMGEDRLFRRGGAPVWFSLGGMRCSAVICYDIRFCELIRRLAVGGAGILFVSAEWPAVRIAQWEILLRARAVENQMYVAACNRCGESGGERFGGGSMVIAPDGTVLARAQDVEAVIKAEINEETVLSARKSLPVFADRIPELY